jgi:hypothetical protein
LATVNVVPDNGVERYLSDAELEARLDYHAREVVALQEELDRRESERVAQEKRRRLRVLPPWTTNVVVAVAALALVAGAVLAPSLFDSGPNPSDLGSVPRVVGEAPMLPTPTAAPTPEPFIPEDEDSDDVTIIAAPEPVVDPPAGTSDDASQPDTPQAPQPEPSDPPVAPDPPPPPPPEDPAPPPEPSPPAPPEPPEPPEPTPPDPPEPPDPPDPPDPDPPDPPDPEPPDPEPTPPPGDRPAIEICLDLDPLLSKICLGLL